MALIFTEGFDRFYYAADMANEGWTSLANSKIGSGRFAGNSLVALNPYNSHPALKTLPNNYQEFYLGFASNSSASLSVVLNESSNNQISIQQNAQGLQLFTYGAYGNSITLASSANGVIPSGGWYYVEIGAHIHASAGWVTVKINGSVVISVSSVQTMNAASSNAYINAMSFYGNIDDLYFLDNTTGSGAYPMNTFIGDKRVSTVYPSANVSTAFANSGNGSGGYINTGWTNGFSASTIYLCSPKDYARDDSGLSSLAGNSSDSVFGCAPKMACDGYIQSLTFYSPNVYSSAKVKPVICGWDSINQVPVGSLIYGNETVGITAGNNTLTFASTAAPVSKDVIYLLGFVSDTALQFSCGHNQNNGFQLSTTYSALPSAWAGAAASYSPYCTYVYTPASNYASVSENQMDGDNTYNSSANTGDIDLFATNASLPSNSNIYAVSVKGSYRHSNVAGSRSVYNLIQSGSTQAQGTQHQVSSTYAVQEDVFPVDPNTGAAWTVAAANSLKIGYKVGA